MKLSTNTRYAVRILFELHGFTEPVSTAYLAEKTGLSLRAVENIQAVLKRNRITSGTVGARGGILLLKPLTDISLGDLVTLFDGGVEFAVCCGDKSNDCPNLGGCEIQAVWRTVSDALQKQLNAVSLDSVLRQYPVGVYGTILDGMPS